MSLKHLNINLKTPGWLNVNILDSKAFGLCEILDWRSSKYACPSLSESDSQAFGVPLSQVIVNDRRHKQLQEEQEEQRSPADRVSSLLHLTGRRSTNKELSSSNSSLSSSSETPNEATTPDTPETPLRSRRRVEYRFLSSRLLFWVTLTVTVRSHSLTLVMHD